VARLLVTGGAGFIGSNFVHYWLARYPQDRLVVLDALTYAGNIEHLASVRTRPEFRFIHGNIVDTALVEQLLREEQLDTIVHFAAESHVDRSIEGPDEFINSNIVGTHSLLKAARRVWLDERVLSQHRFHHVSTDEVYGSLGASEPAFTESTPYAPNSPYSASKAASDHIVRAYHHTYGLNTTISNCSNNYGPRQFAEKLIPVIIARALAGQSLPVYGDGLNIRDWLHVEDHCRGIELVIRRGRVGEVYNIGGRSECNNIRLVRQLCALIDAALEVNGGLRERFPDSPVCRGERSEALLSFVADRPGHDRRYAINCDKIERECDYRPSVSLDAGLRSTVAWYLDHPHFLGARWHRTAGGGDPRLQCV